MLLLGIALWSFQMLNAQLDTSVYYFTLEDCLKYALENSYDRQTMKLTEEATQSKYKFSKQERLPNVALSLGEGYAYGSSGGAEKSSTWSGNYSLSTGIVISQGGSINNTIKQNLLQMEQAGFKTEQFENELSVQILQAFLSALGYQELIRVQESILEATEEQLKQGENQLRLGQILESDYLLLQAQYASDKNNIVDSRINRENSLLSLKSLLSMEPTATLNIIYPDTSAIEAMMILPTEEQAIERAMNSLPSLKVSQYDIEIAKLGIKLAKASYYPSINLSASIGTGHSNFDAFGNQLDNRLNESVNISLSLPIYNRGRTKSNVVQNKIQLQQAELGQLQTELNVRQNVIQQYQNVLGAMSKYEATDVKHNAYYKTYLSYKSRFNVGDITPVDLLQQQNNYITVLNEYIQSKYGFMLKRKILDIYIGEVIKM